MNRRHFIAAAGALGTLAFCSSISWAQSAALAGVKASTNGKAMASDKTILVLGDSLSAEYGLRRGSGWVALLEEKLRNEALAAQVINASISGDTTSGGRNRLPSLLERHRPSHLIIELGGNDALRGLPLQMTQDNLTHMSNQAKDAGAKVLLVGMQVPPNYGGDYARRFASLFEKSAQASGAALVPFLLKGVADGPDPTRWFQSDRIHPTEQAQPAMLANVWPQLRKQLQ